MKRIAVGVLVGLAVGATGAPAERNTPEAPSITQVRAARDGADMLAEMLAPAWVKRTHSHVYNCRPRGCDFFARGTARCRGTVQMRHVRGTIYTGWYSRLRCR